MKTNYVHFLKDISTFTLNSVPTDTYLIYWENKNLPKIDNVTYMSFEEFKIKYISIEPNMLILVNLNRLINPSNRTGFIFEYLFTLTPQIPKYSIDDTPFIGEPWRVWFHYGLTQQGSFKESYSYTVETDWKHWFLREKNICSVAPENIKLFVDSTYSDLDELKTTFTLREPKLLEEEYYTQAKEFVFNKYETPKLLINNLLKLTNKNINCSIDYDTYRTNKNVIVPDFGIYRFMVEENKRRMAIYNKVIGK